MGQFWKSESTPSSEFTVVFVTIVCLVIFNSVKSCVATEVSAASLMVN